MMRALPPAQISLATVDCTWVDAVSSPHVPLQEQSRSWDEWNAKGREHKLGPISLRQADEVERYLSRLGRTDLELIDVGCGTGWLCERLRKYGRVTGTDFAQDVLERARQRAPEIAYMAGDFFALDLPKSGFDVVVSLEVLAHVADQPAFIGRLADLLKPGGHLILATQNRPVLERWSEIGPRMPGTLRHWVDAQQLRALLSAHFENVRVMSVFPVGDRGALRWVNSGRLNRLLGTVVSPSVLERAKERFMLGHTLMAFGTRPHLN